MSNIDLREIPNPGESGHTRDLFELFARDFLAASGYQILEEPARGPDGGKDLVVGEELRGIVSHSEIRWLVSVKHLAHSGKAVGLGDEPNILERVEQIGAHGFLGFYSSVPSVGLAERLRGLSPRIKTELYGPARIIKKLQEASFSYVLQQYLPKAFQAQKTMHSPVRFMLFTEAGPATNCDEIEIDLSSMFVAGSGGSLRIADPELEDIVCACVLASALRSGKFSVLQQFTSFRPLVWHQLSVLVTRSGLDGVALGAEIGTTNNSVYLRLLISISGMINCEEVIETICQRLLVDGRFHHRVIRDINAPMTPFYDVVRDALAQQPPSACTVLERYITVARERRQWAEKRVLEAALRRIHQRPQNPALADGRQPPLRSGWRR